MPSKFSARFRLVGVAPLRLLFYSEAIRSLPGQAHAPNPNAHAARTLDTHLAGAPASRRKQAGVTLVGSTIVVPVLAVVSGLLAPSFDRAMQRHHLEGATAQLETDIHRTRILAVARNAPLRIGFDSDAAGNCYVIRTGGANACNCAPDATAVCQGAAVAERSVRFAAGKAVSLRSNVRSVVFDPVKGTSTPTATVQFTTAAALPSSR